MKKAAWIVLALGVLGLGVAAAQEPRRAGGHPQALQKMKVQRQKMDLEAHRNKLEFRREMDRLTLAQRQIEIERQKARPPVATGTKAASHKPDRRACHGSAAVPLLMLCAVLHLLLTVWVYQDIRKRNAGSGIWIPVTLLAGLCGAAVYALARLGDKPA